MAKLNIRLRKLGIALLSFPHWLRLRAIQKQGLGLPLHVSPAAEYALPESYVKIGKQIGMEWVK